VGLAGVNSINWARVLAQVVYYFTSATALGAPHRAVDFTVPTGNFGDIFAGHIARAMGLPIGRLVIATNQNDILHRALTTGRYETDGVKPSISPSMDIQVSSNFERALYLALDGDGETVDKLMSDLKSGGFTIPQGAIEALRAAYASGRASEEETSATIARIRQTTGELLCPHSAVGVTVADGILGASPIHSTQILPPEASVLSTGAPNPMITLATAHPAKFPDAVEAATGQRPPLPPRMADLFDRPERVTPLASHLSTLQSFIRERINH
jgi:threonine synthase